MSLSVLLIGLVLLFAGDLAFFAKGKTRTFLFMEAAGWLISVVWWAFHMFQALPTSVAELRTFPLLLWSLYGVAGFVSIITANQRSVNELKVWYFVAIKCLLILTIAQSCSDNVFWIGTTFFAMSWVVWSLQFLAKKPLETKVFLPSFLGDLLIFLGLQAFSLLRGTTSVSAILAGRMEFLLPDASLWHFGAGGLILVGGLLKLGLGPSALSSTALPGPFWIRVFIFQLCFVPSVQVLLCRFSSYWVLFPFYEWGLLLLGSTAAFLINRKGQNEWDLYKVADLLTKLVTCSALMALTLWTAETAIGNIVEQLWSSFLIMLVVNLISTTLSSERDLRKMGGLSSYIPLTFNFCWGAMLLILCCFTCWGPKLALSGDYSRINTYFTIILFFIVLSLFNHHSTRLALLVFSQKSRIHEKVLAYVQEVSFFRLSWVVAAGIILFGISATDFLRLLPFQMILIGIRGAPILATSVILFFLWYCVKIWLRRKQTNNRWTERLEADIALSGHDAHEKSEAFFSLSQRSIMQAFLSKMQIIKEALSRGLRRLVTRFATGLRFILGLNPSQGLLVLLIFMILVFIFRK